jgi:multiple sugar transport system ATP-binding protein
MISVEVKNVVKKFGQVEVLKSVSLQVQAGEFLVLVGPSGCGKSTLLRSIAGLEDVTSGDIYIDGRRVNDIDPKDRDIGMVFQSYALYPHMNVFDNMAFGLRMKHMDEGEIKKRVHEAAELLHLTQLLERRPKELSGGQRQRVALGRAIVRKAKVFLFDEPLSNLDAKLRNEMRVEIKRLHRILGNTMIYVTHDQVEATTMGDEIAVLNEGIIQQIGTTSELYMKPVNQFVAGFIGVPEMNFIPGRVNGADFVSTDGAITLSSLLGEGHSAPATEVTLGVRPESVQVMNESSDSDSGLTATVEFIENLGSQNLVHCRAGGFLIRALSPLDFTFDIGSHVRLRPNLQKCVLFDKNSGRAIR